MHRNCAPKRTTQSTRKILVYILLSLIGGLLTYCFYPHGASAESPAPQVTTPTGPSITSPTQKSKFETLHTSLTSSQQAFDAKLSEIASANTNLQKLLPQIRPGNKQTEVDGAKLLENTFRLTGEACETLLKERDSFKEKEAVYEGSLRNSGKELEGYAEALQRKSTQAGPLMGPYYIQAAGAVRATAKTFSSRADALSEQTEAIKAGYDKVEQIKEFCTVMNQVMPLIADGSRVSATLDAQLKQLVDFAKEFDKTIQLFVGLAGKLQEGRPQLPATVLP